MTDIYEPRIVLVGAGRLATCLGRALHLAGIPITQVYSRTIAAATALATMIDAESTADIDAITHEADLYIVALTDTALVELIPRLTHGRTDALWVHTAGSVAMDVWGGHAHRYGVVYPMQTFSKERQVDFSRIPIFVEANNSDDERRLTDLCRRLSPMVSVTDTAGRCALHLAAVLTCNFTNHLYDLADRLLECHGLDFSAMLPLIDETAAKVHHLRPRDAQTGPAARGDVRIMETHMEMLADRPDIREIYRMLSESIGQRTKNK